MRRRLIAGNWKMYKRIDEAVQLATMIKRELLNLKEIDIALCVPYTVLFSVGKVISGTDIGLGAQNLFWEEEGAFTGEISGGQIIDCGAKYVIIGHSERRKYFRESDEEVNKKIRAALKVKLTPIVCVGETLEEREGERTESIIKRQLAGGLKGLTEDDLSRLVIAYEPVWAIGTGRTATPLQAEEVHCFIRKWVLNNFSEAIAKGMRILYGGSVKPANIAELIKKEDIDGALVGGASLEAAPFVDIVKNSLVHK